MQNMFNVAKNIDAVRKAKKEAYDRYLEAENNHSFRADSLYDEYLEYETLEYKFEMNKEEGFVKLTKKQAELMNKILANEK